LVIDASPLLVYEKHPLRGAGRDGCDISQDKGEERLAFKPEVNQRKCRGCETCVDLCTAGVFTMIRRKSVAVNAQACLGCEICVGECKEKAITVKELRASLSETCSFLLRDLPEN